MKKRLLATAILSSILSFTNIANAQYILNDVLYGGTGPEFMTGKNSNDNQVTMNQNISGGVIKGVIGGFAIDKNGGWDNEFDLDAGLHADGNNVTISNAHVQGGKTTISIIGGSSWDRYTFDTIIAGGYSNLASNNKVDIYDSTVETSIYGAYTKMSNNTTEKIYGNEVNINGGNVTGENIAGAYVDDGSTNNNNIIQKNSVTINNNAVIGINNKVNIYGAYSSDKNSQMIGNKVIINSGSLNTSDGSEYALGIYGASADRSGSSACDNSVEINGGTINGDVYGAYAWAGSDSSLSNNTVIIRGGTIQGSVYAASSRNNQGMIQNNGIEITGDADLSEAKLYGLKQEVNGNNSNGQYLLINNYEGTINSADNFNNLEINNSIVKIENINLCTGYDDYGYDVYGSINVENANLTVTKGEQIEVISVKNGELNAVNLSDVYVVNIENSNAKIDKINCFDEINIENKNEKSVELGNVSGDKYYGSRIITDSKIKAESIENLKSLDVDMTSIAWEKDGTVIDVAGKADFNGTTVSVNGNLAAAVGTEISNGDSMSFIKAGELTGIKAAEIKDSKVLIGFAKEADVTLTDNVNSIDFVVSGMPQASDQTTIIGDSRTAAIAFANQGSDVLNEVLSNIDEEEYGIKTFALVHGNRSKYDVASDIKINGWSVLTGVGETKKVNDDLLSWGVFYENGSGNYRTYNNFNGNNLTGFGSSVYNGGGAMLRYDNNSGTYIQAGVRAGNLKNSLGDAVADGFGTVGGYSIDSFYYGTLLGVGKIIQLNETDNIDVYGKYFYTHHDGESVNILGDDVNFDSAESNRVRLGARYNKTLSEKLSGYYGLAWDYEFSGDADTYIAGFDVDNESLKGSTAVIEAGLHYAPDNSPWSIDLGLQGYAGQREGFSGNVQATYTF